MLLPFGMNAGTSAGYSGYLYGEIIVDISQLSTSVDLIQPNNSVDIDEPSIVFSQSSTAYMVNLTSSSQEISVRQIEIDVEVTT